MERVNAICRHDLWRDSVREIARLERDRQFCRHDLVHFLDVARLAYIENLEAELNECKMLNNQLMSDLDADEGLAEICVNEFIADTIKAVKDAGVKKITVEF